jgi:hypothetical protein
VAGRSDNRMGKAVAPLVPRLIDAAIAEGWKYTPRLREGSGMSAGMRGIWGVDDCGVTGGRLLNRSRWPKANDEGATVLGTNAQEQRTAKGCVLCSSLQ